MTQCNTDTIEFKTLGKRSVVANFNGGTITSDAGALLLDKTDQAIALLARTAECFTGKTGKNRDGFLLGRFPILELWGIMGIMGTDTLIKAKNHDTKD